MITLSILKPSYEAWSGFARKAVLLILLLTGVSGSMFAQVAGNITIKGKVTTADDGKGLPGTSIYLKQSQTGTTTDTNGNFEFPKKLKAGDVVVFSYIGYATQEITVQEQMTTLDVEMVFDSVSAFED